MLHETLDTKDWRKTYETFDSVYVEGMRGRFLINRSRLNSEKGLNDVLRAIQKVQTQHKTWKEQTWQPVFDALIENEKSGKITFHAKHESGKFWEYSMGREDAFGGQFGWSWKWVDSVEKPKRLNLGQQFYAANKFEEKFTTKLYILREVLKSLLHAYINKKYSRAWLDKNQFSDKLVKINLRGEQFWFKIGRNRNGYPQWELFIFQSANLEEINL